MSAGAVFKLIVNDGKADRMIMATALLNQRIKDVMCARHQAGKADITPTLADLEQTHILFMNAHFKPFAAIGYEYNKVRPQSGNPQLNNTVTFSIPQFGDFFHDMVVRTRMSAATANTVQTPVRSAPQTAGAVFPANGSDPDGTLNPNAFYQLVDAFGAVQRDFGDSAAVPYSDLVRYVEYPGIKLLTDVRFDVNGNPLDEYTDVCGSFYQKYRVQPNKETGYNRLVGQETPVLAVTGPELADVTDNEAGTTVLGGDTSRGYRQVVNGPQTPKATQPVLDLWTPLLFWFNKDVRLSIPSVSIPYGQRFITIALEQQDCLVRTFPNLYLRTVIDDGNNRDVSYTPISAAASAVNAMQIEQLEMYINNIFVNPEIHDIYIKRIGFSLIRVHRTHTVQVTATNGDEQLTQLKWPIEYIFACLQPTWNADKTNPQYWRDWHRCCKNDDGVSQVPAYKAEINTSGGPLGPPESTYSETHVVPDSYPICVNTIDTLTVTAHGIRIYDTFLHDFFANYLPYHFGGYNIRTPEDEGALMINFSLYPGTYQPSGHINISRAREFFFQWASSYISSTNPARLIACAIAINFLLVTDGSAVLRYST